MSFDNHVGHDYLEDYEERYNFYHQEEEKIPFDLDYFNKITKGGLPNKTLNARPCWYGRRQVSIHVPHTSAPLTRAQRSTLHLKWQRRELLSELDANLLNVNIQEIVDLPRLCLKTKLIICPRRLKVN